MAMRSTYQFQNRDLHHTLIKVCRFIFDHLDGNDLVGLHVLTLDYLSKGSLAENIQDEVTAVRESLENEINEWTQGDALVAILVPQPVVDVKDVVIIFVVVAVVMGGLAGLCKDAAGVVC